MSEGNSIRLADQPARLSPVEPGEARRPRRVATLDIEPLRGELARTELATVSGDATIDLGQAEAWELVLTLDGRPCKRLILPDPGPTPKDGLLEATALAACRVDRAREILARSLHRRMGAEQRHYPVLPVSVVVCTRGRPRSLTALLDALGALDPKPLEVVVVDNAPAEGEDCRELAEEAGAVYVREDTPGLNNARRAGVDVARGELLAFTDDDCLPPLRWLAVLPELFDDRTVAAATGPGFPAALDTRPQLLFERVASFSRGLERREWDFRILSPALAARAGAGANMVLRRDALEQLGEVFPPELDAGTPTRSGGDTYALFRMLAAGRRVIYEPRLYTYHRHRADPRALHRAIRGYGVGLGAVAARLLADERETGALLIYRWLVRQYLATVAKGLIGTCDRVEVRLAWDYLRGGIAGPAAWRRSRRRHQGAARAPSAPPMTPEAGGTEDTTSSRSDARGGAPEVSVVVVTHRPGELPGRCLAGLAAQTDAPSFEVILVDDSRPGVPDAIPLPPGLAVRRLRTGGRGAAGARNAGAAAARGELLIFLDDDLIPAAELVAVHARRQRSERDEAVVVGYSPPRPLQPTLAALSASLWWEDHFRAKRDALAPTFTEMLSGNVSVSRETFEQVGPFDADFGVLRREDWEWGIRALQAEVGLAYEPLAVAHHRFSLDTRGRLAAARAEGAGDALLVERHPLALPSLPAGGTPPVGGAFSRLAFRLMLHDRVRERSVALLDALERLRMRRAWAHWAHVAQCAAYEAGQRDRLRRPGAPSEPERSISVDLLSDEPVRPPRVAAPLLDLTLAGRRVARVRAADGQWTASLAERAARRLPGSELERYSSLISAAPARGGDPKGVAVVFDPAWDRGRDTNPIEHWRAIDRAVRESAREIVAAPLPGVEVTADWLEPVAAVLGGERVAALVGARFDPGRAAGPVLHSRATLETSYPAIGLPSQYVAVRRDAYAALGGFDPAAARLGHQGAVLDLLERALDAGWVIGYCDTSGIEPIGDARALHRRAEWERWQARGALMRGAARARGSAWWLRSGLSPVLVRVLRAARTRRGLRGALGVAAAFLVGSLASPPPSSDIAAGGMD